ncbi:Nuclear pore complex protein, partial [Phytophthora palmivora]
MASSSTSAFEILRSTRQLPVVEKELVFGKRSTEAAAARSTAGAAWGKTARKWVAASSSTSALEFGDVMPRELRTLVAASFDVFTRVQQTSQLGAFGVARASREYREALKTCIFALEDRLETQTINAEEEGEFLDLLKVSLAIWHLCELLLLRGGARGADKTLAYDLALWLQEHYCSTLLDKTESESERLKKQQKPEQDAAFWTTIQSLVMTGNVQKLLLTMPGRAEQDGVGWKNWNDACQYLLNTDGYVKANTGLTTLLEIMAAKENVLKAHASS